MTYYAGSPVALKELFSIGSHAKCLTPAYLDCKKYQGTSVVSIMKNN
jgi:hypothetical protein